MMSVLAQAEVVIIKQALEELLRQQPPGGGNVLWFFVVALVLICAGAFYVLRYFVTVIKAMSDTFNMTILRMSRRFHSELSKQRRSYERMHSEAREMVHAARNIAEKAVRGGDFEQLWRESEDKLMKERGEQPPATGPGVTDHGVVMRPKV